jgi:hypothetical protein
MMMTRLKEGPLLGALSKRERVVHVARGTTREHQSLLGLITLFSSLVFDTVVTPLHQLGSKGLAELTATHPVRAVGMADKWVEQMALTGPTNMRAGLHDVVNYHMADCVYLVSDGRADNPLSVLEFIADQVNE